ncbi:NAD-dependent epimerase, partial [Tateyamaria sp.]|nr:NAD-dependent epimerase [Tateyamaria sp.]
TSYGAQKLACEIMIQDFSRKGFIDGISLRLPTICVRPGKPNLAASSFFSGIIREPLNGIKAILPVADTVRHWHASPRSAASFLAHAAGLDTSRLDGRRALNLPGLSCTVAQQIEALREVAGNDVVALIKLQPDPEIIRIVAGWPKDFAPERAIELGFAAEETFNEIINVYLEDDSPSL